MTTTERPTFYRRWLSPEGYLGLHLAVGFVVTLVAGIAFGLIARAVFGAPEALLADNWAQATAQSLTYPRLTALMRAITFLGTPPALSAMSALIAAWLIRVKSHRRLYAFLAAMLGGLALMGSLKVYFKRARPAEMGLLATASGYSFPSGHSMCSMTFFGSLAYVIYFSDGPRRWRLLGIAGCGLAVLLIGLSRVYLGVHYLSDVVAGWAAGLCWMGVCLSGVESWVRWRDWRRRRRDRVSSKKSPVTASVSAALLLSAPLAARATTAAGPVPPPPCAACIAWEATPDQAVLLLERPDRLEGLELLVRAEGSVAPDLWDRLRARGVRTGGVFTMDTPVPAVGAGATIVLALAPAAEAGAEPAAGSSEALAFRIKAAATEARARNPGSRVGLEAPSWILARLVPSGLSAYVDFIVLGVSEAMSDTPARSKWVRLEPSAPEELLEGTRTAAVDRFFARVADLETPLVLLRLAALLPAGLAPLPELRLTCAGGADATCASEVFLDPRTLEGVALVRPQGGVTALITRPPAANAILQPLAASDPRPLVAESTGRWRLPDSDRPFVVRLSGWMGAASRFASGVEVSEDRVLSVEEIVAAHQAAARRQGETVTRLIASGRSVVTFQAPGLAAPMTVTARTVLYAERDRLELEERDLRLNGVVVPVPADGVPRLPLVEPERVTRPPLALTLDQAYRYALAGRERVAGRPCYVVAFEPREGGATLFRGRAWIAADDFGMVRTRATRTGLRGAIVSSEEEDEFVKVALGSSAVWLLARTEAHQVYEGPGHRTPIHRVMTFDRHEPNPPDFETRRGAAEASTAVLLRDTPDGLRYLRRPPTARNAHSSPRPIPSDGASSEVAATGRVLADRATRVRALAAGVLRDPNISVPLPFVGLSYVDLDFLHRGGQVNLFAGLGFVQAAWRLPALGRSRWRLQGSAFATGAEYNDRSFQDGLERYEQNLRQRPARLALSLDRPLSARLRVRVGYDLAYVRLRRGETTAPDFVVPVSPLTHGLRLGLEGERGPWTGSAWWAPAWRQSWRAWGPATTPEPARRTFQRFGLLAGRSFVFGPRVVGRLEGSVMDGRNLDRFSRYTFDAFETRLHGYPSASLRFDRGLVARSALVWSPGRGLRLDAFADCAWVRDPGFGEDLRANPGLGAAFESPAPWHALLNLEWGYGFQARDPEGRRGTHVFRATLYRIF